MFPVPFRVACLYQGGSRFIFQRTCFHPRVRNFCFVGNANFRNPPVATLFRRDCLEAKSLCSSLDFNLRCVSSFRKRKANVQPRQKRAGSKNGKRRGNTLAGKVKSGIKRLVSSASKKSTDLRNKGVVKRIQRSAKSTLRKIKVKPARLVRIAKRKIQMNEASELSRAKRAESKAVKSGILKEPFAVASERLQWFRSHVDQLKQNAAQKMSKKAKELLARYENEPLKKSPVNLRLIKKQARKESKKGLINIDNWGKKDFADYYQTTVQDKENKKSLEKARRKVSSLVASGKADPSLKSLPDNEMIDWYRKSKEEKELMQGRKLAKKLDAAGLLPFPLSHASDRLIVLWFRRTKEGFKAPRSTRSMQNCLQ